MKFGLKDETIIQLQNIFSHCHTIEKVIIYGSRAKGSYKPGSDVDLTLVGNDLNLSNSVYPVMDAIEELLLPYMFDISIYSAIDNPDLVDHIKRVGQLFYEKA